MASNMSSNFVIYMYIHAKSLNQLLKCHYLRSPQLKHVIDIKSNSSLTRNCYWAKATAERIE